MQYIPDTWKLGKLVAVEGILAQVVECDRAGHELGKSLKLKLKLNQRRTFILNVRHGIRFSDQTIVEPKNGKVQVGDKIIFELRHNEERKAYACGWATLSDYAKALREYDASFSPRAVSFAQRFINPPDERRVPYYQYVTERFSGPIDIRLGALDHIKVKLEQAPVVQFYPDDPEFERSLTAEELLKVKGMSKYARKKFRQHKLSMLATA